MSARTRSQVLLTGSQAMYPPEDSELVDEGDRESESETDEDHRDSQNEQEKTNTLSTNMLLQQLSKQISDMRSEISCMSSKLDQVVADSKQNEAKTDAVVKDVSSMREDVSSLQQENAQLKSDNKRLKDRLDKLESYSRRDNLIFHGVQQKPDEDCHRVAQLIMQNNLNIPHASEMKFDRCHRIPGKTKPQPLIVQFNYSVDRDKVWQARKNLSGSNISLREDFPEEIVARRNALYPIMMKARDLKHKAFLRADKLVIDDRTYTIENLHTLPKELDPANITTKRVGDVVAFYSAHSPLSNFHHSPFTLDGKTYPHTEQFLQHQKAIFANDLEKAKQICVTSSPIMCKKLGDSVSVVLNDWLPHAENLLVKACKAKFMQNARAKKFLLDTKDATLAEATTDRHWGTGLKLNHKDIGIKNEWKGKNTFGNILMNVRQYIVQTQ